MQAVLQNRYHIQHLLGQGGMGTVWMAQDMRLNGRACVIKQLREDFFRDEDKQRAISFFEREIDMLIKLQHPYIVAIHDRFKEDDKYFLVMEYVMGEDFHTMMQRREGEPYDEEEVVGRAQEICEVLEYLHGQEVPVIYRDLKPSNIMVNVKGQIKLVDFGIARPVADENENTHVVSAGYSPPEQYWGGASPQSDIYALGATMYFLLTGKDPEPLKACSPRAINPNVSEKLDLVIQKATAQDPTQRYNSAQEFNEALLHRDYEEAPENIQAWFKRIVCGVLFVMLFIIVFYSDSIGAFFTGGQQNKPVASTTTTPSSSAKNTNLSNDELKKITSPDPTFGGAAPQKDFALQVSDEKSLTDPNPPK